MYIVHVFIHVKTDLLEAFKEVSLDNARNSLLEPGIARFDLIQQADDPTRFVLVEVYRTPEDAPKHKETAHYNRWRELAEPMLAEPRTRIIYSNVFPAEDGWDSHAL
jgi:(4S)-4-hydroxy-5-phosphonooxypentane-2,3-dione isomerase